MDRDDGARAWQERRPVTTLDTPGARLQPLHDVRGIYAELRRLGLLDPLRALQRPSAFKSLVALGFDWACILAAWALVLWAPLHLALLTVPLAVLLMGARQRALGNLLHEAGHKMLCGSRGLNDHLADLAVGIPTLSPVRCYRAKHLKHHAHLGVAESDPDFIHAEEDLQGTAWSLFARHFFDRGMFLSNLFGNWGSLSARERVAAAVWWALLLGALALAAGPAGALVFAVLWIVARMTVFHGITVFREISDHVGLQPGSVLGFTRNSPHKPVLSFFLHPHENNYHLTHHLAPTVPFHRLRAAHKIFMQVPEYAAAHQCDSYFSGRRSVIACWVRGCLRWHRGGKPAAESAAGA